MITNNDLYDDLTQIPGIKSARQSWFAEAFGVRTYDDLTRLSADDIENRLKADGKPYKRSVIELWLQEAARLAARKKIVVEQNSSQTKSKFTNPKNKPETDTSSQNTKTEHWHQVAYFNISYLERRVKDQVIERKTHINYHETDAKKDWDGFETEQIGEWILKQAGDKLRQNIREISATNIEIEEMRKEVLPARIAISVSSLRLYQPDRVAISLDPGDDGRPYSGTIQAGMPFIAVVEFEIGDQIVTSLGKREIPYQVQFYTKNSTTKDKVHLGNALGMLVGGKSNYSAELSGIMLSPGDYCLRGVVLAESENETPGYFELPRLRAVGE